MSTDKVLNAIFGSDKTLNFQVERQYSSLSPLDQNSRPPARPGMYIMLSFFIGFCTLTADLEAQLHLVVYLVILTFLSIMLPTQCTLVSNDITVRLEL